MKLLLISNSTNAGEAYLDHPKKQLKEFYGQTKKVLFFPYAAVTFSFDDYARKVQDRFDELGLEVDSIHTHNDPLEAVKNAQAIAVGGGNTWQLLRTIQQQKLLPAIAEKVRQGTPYAGWSAGSNLACPTIKTTNDMPITEPLSFAATGLIPFQINPHYLDANPDGHAGETREQRIEEFLVANPGMYVIGLREGMIMEVENQKINIIGKKNVRVFRHAQEAMEYTPDESLDFLF